MLLTVRGKKKVSNGIDLPDEKTIKAWKMIVFKYPGSAICRKKNTGGYDRRDQKENITSN